GYGVIFGLGLVAQSAFGYAPVVASVISDILDVLLHHEILDFEQAMDVIAKIITATVVADKIWKWFARPAESFEHPAETQTQEGIYQIARSILGNNEFLAKPRDFEKWVTTEWGEKPNGWSNPVQDYIPKSLDDNQRKNLHALM